MSSIQEDFDRIALVSADGAKRNDLYHDFLLRQLPSQCENSLDIGCGTGSFTRRLAERSQRVLAIDFSPEMIRIARERSGKFSNIDFQLADVLNLPFDARSFDCIATIATLHHLPLEEMLLKMKVALKPGGELLILDLFEAEGVTDALLNLAALPVSVGLRLIHHGRLLPPRAEQAAWNAHADHDLYPKMREVRALCDRILPGAKVKKHLLWRYSVVWKKP